MKLLNGKIVFLVIQKWHFISLREMEHIILRDQIMRVDTIFQELMSILFMMKIIFVLLWKLSKRLEIIYQGPVEMLTQEILPFTMILIILRIL